MLSVSVVEKENTFWGGKFTVHHNKKSKMSFFFWNRNFKTTSNKRGNEQCKKFSQDEGSNREVPQTGCQANR